MPAPSFWNSRTASAAASGDRTTAAVGMGTPYSARSCRAWYSWIFMGEMKVGSGHRRLKWTSAAGYVIIYVITTDGEAMETATKLKVRTIGNSMGVILPRELLERLRVSNGDTLHALETSRGIELVAFDPELARQMEVAEGV